MFSLWNLKNFFLFSYLPYEKWKGDIHVQNQQWTRATQNHTTPSTPRLVLLGNASLFCIVNAMLWLRQRLKYFNEHVCPPSVPLSVRETSPKWLGIFKI